MVFSLYLLFFLGKFYLLFASLIADRLIDKRPFPKGSAKKILRLFFEPLRVVAPLALVGVFFYWFLANISHQLRFFGKDLLLFHLDEALFGSALFFWLPNIFLSSSYTAIFHYAYFSLAPLMSITFGMLFVLSPENLFRKATISFIFSLILAFPLFYAFSCQGPYHFFIENLRNNEFSKNIQQLQDAYHPTPETFSLIKRIGEAEKDTARDNAVPISCFPSMHAVWGLFIVFFLARVRKWSLMLTLPWLTLMLVGGLYFAQHYAVDYIVALPVGAASMWIAELLLRPRRHDI